MQFEDEILGTCLWNEKLKSWKFSFELNAGRVVQC